ncbi:MAG: hypothetical protein ABJB86_04105 [Bacteroidota bacterium]
MNNWHKYILVISFPFIFLLHSCNKKFSARYFKGAKYEKTQLQPGNIDVPQRRSMVWKDHSVFADSIYNIWARRPIPDWNKTSKGDAPRIFLDRFLTGRDIKETNQAIQKSVPHGVTGSTWALNKKGDYDFSITILTTILWLFGDRPEVLYPQTKKHLLDILLTADGNKFHYTAPKTWGMVRETENHILMTEGSRYLKNRWIMEHGNTDPYYNNLNNGMEDKLLAVMRQMSREGLNEFNSLPYTGYTITALLNLEAFGSGNIKTAARNVLDYMNWCYALGSYRLKHFAPMRRRYEKAGFQFLTTDYHSVFMKAWLGYSTNDSFNKNIDGALPHALMGSCMPYRPSDEVVEMLFNKGSGYFVKLGHGPYACPEIYAAGKHFLISAGGANRGKKSIIVPRPICIFLNDPADKLSDVIHLAGPGTDFMQWNNTGVYKNFACAAGPVYVPSSMKPMITKGDWSVYSMHDSITIAVYSTAKCGLVIVFEQVASGGLIDELLMLNPTAENLNMQFVFPGGQKINYDLTAAKDKWIIVSAEGKNTDREYDKWPLIEGDIYKN